MDSGNNKSFKGYFCEIEIFYAHVINGRLCGTSGFDFAFLNGVHRIGSKLNSRMTFKKCSLEELKLLNKNVEFQFKLYTLFISGIYCIFREVCILNIGLY